MQKSAFCLANLTRFLFLPLSPLPLLRTNNIRGKTLRDKKVKQTKKTFCKRREECAKTVAADAVT